MIKLLLLFLILYPQLIFADTNSNQSQLLIGDINGTNAGRYRSLKFTNGTTTNNNDGSISVTSGGGGGGTPGGANTQVQYNSSGSFAGNSGFIYDGTNVGIGTTTLPSILTVGTNTVNGIGVYNATGTLLNTIGNDGSSSNGEIALYSSGTNTISLDSGALEQISGYDRATGDLIYRAQATGSGSTTGEFYLQNGNTENVQLISNGVNFITGASGQFSVGNQSPTGLFSVGSASQFQINSSGNVSTSGGYLQSGSTLNEFTGNVGIGSPNPGTSLDVNGSVRLTGFVLNSSPTNGYVLTSDANGGGTWKAATSGSGTINSGTTNRAARYSGATTLDSSTKIFDDGTNVGIGTIAPRTTVELGVQTLNIAGANVGIGTVGPRNALEVNGNINMYANGSQSFLSWGPGGVAAPGANSAGTKLQLYGSTLGSIAVGDFAIGIASGEMWFNESGSNLGWSFNTNSVRKARISGTGQLVLGNDNPINQIDVTGSAAFGTYGGVKTAPTNGLVISGNVGIGTWIPGNALSISGGLDTSGNTSNSYLNSTGGNVGIGSSNPQALLDLGTSGTIISHSTTGLGWSVKTGANTACNTTCGASACVFGFDTGLGGSDVVNCASALADTCVCAGP